MGILWLTPAIRAQDPFPIEIDVRGAEDPDYPMLVAEGGWPLTIELSLNETLGLWYLGTDPYPAFPTPLTEINSIQSGAIGIVLFSNPDGIVNPEDPQPKSPEYYCLSFLEDYFGTADTRSFRKELLSQVNHRGCPAKLFEDQHLYFALGTDVGAAAIDWPAAYGYPGLSYPPTDEPQPPSGMSPRIPGLMILSDSGIGNLYRKDGYQSYGLKSPRVARNLAAYINSAGYFMRNSQGKTVIAASWIAPKHIISPYIQRDSNYGGRCNPPVDEGSFETALRINGGPIQIIEESTDSDSLYSFSRQSFLSDYLLQNYQSKLRIFVINGPAPNELMDSNNDGVVDSQDAVVDGYELLSEEKSISLRTVFVGYWGNYVDLDRNGCTGPLVLPAGAGGLGRIPQ